MDDDIPTLLRPTSAYRSYERESKQTLERLKQKATASSGRPSFGFPRNVDHYDIVYVLNHAEQQKEELRTSGMKFGRPPPRDIFTTTTDVEDNVQIRALRTSRSPTMATIDQQEFPQESKDNPKTEMNRVNSAPRNSKAVFATQDPSPPKEADQKAPHQPSNSQPIQAEKFLLTAKASQSKFEVPTKDRITVDNTNNSTEKSDKNPKATNKSKIPIIKMPSNPVLAVLKSRPKTTPSPSRSKQKPAVQKPSSTTLSSNTTQQQKNAIVNSDTPTENTEGMELKSSNDDALSSIAVESSSVTPNGTKIINLRLRNSFDLTPDQNDPAQKNLSLFFMAAATPTRQTVAKVPSFDTLPEIVQRSSHLVDNSSAKDCEDVQDIGQEMTNVQESIVQKQRTKSEIEFPSSLISTAELIHVSEEPSVEDNAKDNVDTEGVDVNKETELVTHISTDTDDNVIHEATDQSQSQLDISPKVSIALVEQMADAVIAHAVAVAMEEVVVQSQSSHFNDNTLPENKNQSIQEECMVKEEPVLNQQEIISIKGHENQEVNKPSKSEPNLDQAEVNKSIPDENENLSENQIQELPFGTVFDVFLERYLNPSSNITEDELPRKKSKHKTKHKHKQNDQKKHHKNKQKKKISDGDFFSSDSDSGKEEDYDGDADDHFETPLYSEEGSTPLISSSHLLQAHRHKKSQRCKTCSMLRREKQMLRSMYKSWREVRRLHHVIHHKEETKQDKNNESRAEGEEEFTLPPDRLLSLCLQEMNKLSVESHQAIIDCYRAMASQTPHRRTVNDI